MITSKNFSNFVGTWVLSAKQIVESEQLTMNALQIDDEQLMKNAVESFMALFNSNYHEFVHLLDQGEGVYFHPFLFFCGHGNNGGDGLQLAHIFANKYRRTVTIVVGDDKKQSRSPLNEKIFQHLSHLKNPYLSVLTYTDYLKSFENEKFYKKRIENAVVFDALFGIGLNKPVIGQYAEMIHHINQHYEGRIISVDVPSGLFIDISTPQGNPIIMATRTLTFSFQKRAFLCPENSQYVGKWKIVDMGLIPIDLCLSGMAPACLTIHAAASLLKNPGFFDHKGTNGHGLLIAGSKNMPGAAILASKAAMRTGIGKVTVHTPDNVANILPIAVPEAVLDIDRDRTMFTEVRPENWDTISAVAVGCGIGKEKKSATGLKDLIDIVHCPMIFDADALNILAENRDWLCELPPNSILTPHFKEFERLIEKKINNHFERLAQLQAFASEYNLIMILKGAYTAIAAPTGQLYFNMTGNPGMATAGSGDVLTGMILANLSKGYQPLEAAILSVTLHGLAGDIAAEQQKAPEALIASDIIENIGSAISELRKMKQKKRFPAKPPCGRDDKI